jgi:hypothetical protein
MVIRHTEFSIEKLKKIRFCDLDHRQKGPHWLFFILNKYCKSTDRDIKNKKEEKMLKKLSVLATALFLLTVTGCSVNNISSVVQPEEVKQNETFDVYILDIYAHVNLYPNLMSPVVEDSMILAAALPSGWSLNSASYAVDQNAYATFMNFMPSDTAFDSTAVSILDLQSYIDSLESMAVAANRYQAGDPLLQQAYDVGGRQFISYLGTDIIDLPAGTPMDTMIIDTEQTLGQDTLYLKMVGVFIKLSVTAGPDAGEFPLGYFLGMDMDIQPPDTANLNLSMLNAFSDSNMITVTGMGIDKSVDASENTTMQLEVFPNPVKNRVNASYYLPASVTGKDVLLGIYDITGREYCKHDLNSIHGWNTLTWNADVPNGTYVLRLTAGKKSYTRTIKVVK